MLPAATALPFGIAKEWLIRLYDELRRVATLRKTEIQKIADVGGGDPEYLAKFYVQPDCQQFNPADDNEDESSVVVREPVLKRLETYLGGPSVHSRNQLFILSDAGMGKTSLLVMLRLAHLTAFWPKGYGCELFKLSQETLQEVAKLPNKANTVLLLDALDEDPLAWGRIEARLAEILRATSGFRRVLITCRTQFFSAGDDPFNRRGAVEVSGFTCPVIYNSLFSDEQTAEYLERRAAEHREIEEWLPKAREIVTSMGSLRMRPMLLTHVDDFLESNESRWNEYTVYRALIRSWLLREQRKLLAKDEGRPSVDELWQACRQLALFLSAGRQPSISEEDLKFLIRSSPEVASIPFMHIGGRWLLNKDSQGNYRFSHYSIQEFLIVNAVLDGGFHVEAEAIRPTDFMARLAVAWLRDASPKEASRMRVLPVPLTNMNLSNADLSSYELSELVFDGTDFSGANLTGTRFMNGSLRGCNMSGAILHNTILKAANLEGAVLAGVDANRAEFQWAILRDARLDGAKLSRSNLHYAKLTGAIYDKNTDWPLSVVPAREGAILGP